MKRFNYIYLIYYHKQFEYKLLHKVRIVVQQEMKLVIS